MNSALTRTLTSVYFFETCPPGYLPHLIPRLETKPFCYNKALFGGNFRLESLWRVFGAYHLDGEFDNLHTLIIYSDLGRVVAMYKYRYLGYWPVNTFVVSSCLHVGYRVCFASTA